VNAADMALSVFFDELASDSPAPGGGTVAALGAAAAAGLVSMVARLTLGKEKFRDHWKEMETIAEKSDVLRSRFLRLMKEDADAFNEFMAAMKLPKETEEQKKTRADAMQDALLQAAEVPLETLRLCADIALLASATAERGNPNALTDAGAAAAFALSAAQTAAYNVRINTKAIRDQLQVARLEKETKQHLQAVRKFALQTTDFVEAQLS
jgi:formiminotetrahydrofolate cyclodeaminase